MRRFEAVKQKELICSFGLHEKEGPEMREQDERERKTERQRERLRSREKEIVVGSN